MMKYLKVMISIWLRRLPRANVRGALWRETSEFHSVPNNATESTHPNPNPQKNTSKPPPSPQLTPKTTHALFSSPKNSPLPSRLDIPRAQAQSSPDTRIEKLAINMNTRTIDILASQISQTSTEKSMSIVWKEWTFRNLTVLKRLCVLLRILNVVLINYDVLIMNNFAFFTRDFDTWLPSPAWPINPRLSATRLGKEMH